jgi:O-antigen ligase
LDRLIFMALIACGANVLRKRRVSLAQVVRENRCLTLYFVYCFLAIFWSDFAFVSFKRWIKTIGEPIMVLVVVTEPDPAEAISRLMKRMAYLLMPYSIMLIKYFPEIGTRYSQWGGRENMGASAGKNTLGYLCLVLGLFLFSHFLTVLKLNKTKFRRNELFLTIILLLMVWWNLNASDSSTSLMSLLLGISTMLFLGRRFVSQRYLSFYLFTIVAVYVAADVTFDLSTIVLRALGRDATLTGRTDLWEDLLAMKIDPIFGVGFESFWLGDRLKYLWSIHWWQPNEAHNGYLETYLNLGMVGVSLAISLIISTYRKGRATLFRDFEYGRLRLGFLTAFVVFNWTEAAFRALHLMFLAFYMVAVDYQGAGKRYSSLAARGASPDVSALTQRDPIRPRAAALRPGAAALRPKPSA